MDKPSVIFFGANGYIGRNLCFYLDKMGWNIKTYGRKETRHPSLPLSIPYAQLDITNKKSVQAIDFKTDFIFHFSGLTGTKGSFNQYEEFTRVNELGLLNVLNSIKELEVKPRIVFPSSRLVYKGSTNLLKEEDDKEAKTIYAANKLNCERFLQAYNEVYNIPFTVFRICVPYGNLLDDTFSYGTIGFFLEQARSRQNITLYGDGQLKRTFTPIDLLCRQIEEVSRNEASANEIYNVGGEQMSLAYAAQLISQKYNVGINYIPWPLEDLKLESGDTVFNDKKIFTIAPTKKDFSFKKWISNLALY